MNLLLRWKVTGGTPQIMVEDAQGAEIGVLPVESADVEILGDENTATSIIANVLGIQSLIDAGIKLSKKII